MNYLPTQLHGTQLYQRHFIMIYDHDFIEDFHSRQRIQSPI